ncbi:MAG TPA: TIGR00289 family protein [Candidatus Nanopusillus sp.]|nr:TIGR00289 family protein [Candidatus Nanopusillus sp.]HIP90225.1 TIGR00289 family protein [Candidatus Nanopusillus sp.]
MKLAVLYSGGKDSNLALYRAMLYHDIEVLINLFPMDPESYLFHVPNAKWTTLQAKAIGIPIIQWKTSGEKEKELEDLKRVLEYAISEYEIEGIVTGAIRSTYQAAKFQKVCRELGLWCFNPLWLSDEVELLLNLINNKFKVIITGIFAYPLGKSLLGKVIDMEVIDLFKKFKKKYGLNPAGEGGEIETFVIDAPFFRERIEIVDYEIKYKEYSGVFIIRDAKLVKK